MSQPDLFPVEETLSPFAQWKREHKVETEFEDDCDGGDWTAIIDRDCGELLVGYGPSEEAACIDLAEQLDIPHWLEGRAL